DRHFLTFSCYRRKPFFNDATLCDLFLKALERVRPALSARNFGYVVMPEHVHLLVSEPQRETLSTAMQALKLSFIQSFEVSRAVSIPKSRNTSETWGTPTRWSENQTGVHFSPNLRGVGVPNHFWQARFY